ncbi:MAG: hypothetical protein J6X05_03770 [Bacteroidales bacterium]|nr:hypothetical protein [Bacteroidales bacterium]
MNKKTIIIACGAAVIVIGILLWWLLSRPASEVINIEKFDLLKEQIVPMRLKVIGRSDGSSQIAVKFFDVDGKAVGRGELPYFGGSITQRIMDVNINGRHVFFPREMIQLINDDEKSTPLQDCYVKDGFPMIYDSQVADPALKDEIRRLYSHILAGDTARLHKLYGTIRQIDITLGEPTERVNYSLNVKASGEVGFKGGEIF